MGVGSGVGVGAGVGVGVGPGDPDGGGAGVGAAIGSPGAGEVPGGAGEVPGGAGAVPGGGVLPPLVVPEPGVPGVGPEGFVPPLPCPGRAGVLPVSTEIADGVLAAALAFGDIPGAVSVKAVVPETIAAPQFQPRRSTQATSGSWAIHDAKPTTRQSRPIEMLRNARTTTGSNWLPEHLTSSCRAADTLTGLRYGRTAVMTS